MLCLDDCLTQPSCHNELKSLNSFSVSFLAQRAQRVRRGREESETIDDPDDAIAHMGDVEIQ
jgi:hypothetical protein